MDEKLIENEQEQPVSKKKAYTPPALTVYGKLAELTESGMGSKVETNPMGQNDKRP